MRTTIQSVARALLTKSIRAQMVGLIVAGGISALVPFLFNEYWVRIAAFVLVNVGLASSWNIIGGYAGYASFGHGVFFGIGAFVGAIGTVRFGLPLAVVVILAGGITSVLALVFTPILKQRGLYFALSTLAVMLLFENVLQTWPFTRGLQSWDLGWNVETALTLKEHYYLFLCMVIVLLGSVIWMAHSRIGYALNALRKDEALAASIGVHVLRYKVIAFVLSAVWPGVLGAVFAPFIGFVSVQSVFDIRFTLNMILATIFGGAGTALGPAIGAISLSIIDQITWGNFLEYHRMIYGILIVAIVVFAPEGLTRVAFFSWRTGRCRSVSVKADHNVVDVQP